MFHIRLWYLTIQMMNTLNTNGWEMFYACNKSLNISKWKNAGCAAIDIITDPHFIFQISVLRRQNCSSTALCNYNNRFFRLHAFQMIRRSTFSFACKMFSWAHRLRYSKFRWMYLFELFVCVTQLFHVRYIRFNDYYVYAQYTNGCIICLLFPHTFIPGEPFPFDSFHHEEEIIPLCAEMFFETIETHRINTFCNNQQMVGLLS